MSANRARGAAAVAIAVVALMVGMALAVLATPAFSTVAGPSISLSPATISGAAPAPGAPSSTPSPPAATAPTSAAAGGFGIDSARAATVQADRSSLLASGGNMSLFLPPNLHQAPSLEQTQGHVVPLYAAAPAPMGVAYYGLNSSMGTIQATTVNTTSLQSYFTTGDSLGVETEEFDFGTQTTYGAQLNAVLTNVTILGQTAFGPNVNAPSGCSGFYTGALSNYCPNEFWLQNVINYNTATHSLTFENNIWNFSNPAAAWSTSNGFTLHGRSNPNGEYYGVGGPSFTIAYPFTVVLYLNTTVGPCTTGTPGAASCTGIASGPVNEVFFNYTVLNSLGQVVCPVTNPTHTVCGEYDDVFWNSISTSVNPSGISFGSAQIQANGSAYNPVGLTNDWEMDYGIGSSSGATTIVYYADAQVGINYCPAANTITSGPQMGKCTAYAAPPAAYDYGGETGETNTGANGYWTTQTVSGPNPSFLTPLGQPVARFVTGPSLLDGLWNASAGLGAYALSYAHIQPANAWVGIAAGAGVTDQADFQVAPTFGWFSFWAGSGGSPTVTPMGANLYLEPGTYTVEVLLSGYDPIQTTVNLASSNQAPVISLTRDASTGVYTPIWAFGNSDLANISTNAGSFGLGQLGNPYRLDSAAPTVGAPYGVSGSVSWLFSDLNDYLFTVWIGEYLNSTTSYAQSNPGPSFVLEYPSWQLSSLAFFNVPSTDQLQFYFYHVQNFTLAGTSGIYAWANSEATSVYSVVCNACHNDLIADNSFAVSDLGMEFINGGTTLPAGNALLNTRNVVWGNTFTPDHQPTYTGLIAPSTGLVIGSRSAGESYDRVWNNAFYTNGTASASSASSDFWNVTCQSGYAPLSQPSYPGTPVCEPASYVTSYLGFSLSGSILGTSYQGGNFWFNYGNAANPYANIPYDARSLSISSSPAIGATVNPFRGDYAPLISYTVYQVTFTETGLPSSSSASAFSVLVTNGVGYPWTNQTATSATPGGCAASTVCVNFYLPAGTYSFAGATGISGYGANPATGSVIVTGPTAVFVTIAFLPAFAVTFTETGLPASTRWYVNISGQKSLSSTTATIVTSLPNAVYTFTAASVNPLYAIGYTPGFTVSGAPLPVGVTFAPLLTAPSAPTVSATTLDVDQPLSVSGTIPTTGIAPYAWAWLVSVNGGSLGSATQCLSPSGTGASAGATENCVVPGATLTAGDTYAFALRVTDSAITPETQTSADSATVSVSTALTPPGAPLVSATALDYDQALGVSGTVPSTGTPPYSWQWLVSVDGAPAVDATVCSVNSGTGASAGATVTCAVPGSSLIVGDTYAFELQVNDSANLEESQTSTASSTASVASQLTAPTTPTVSATALDSDQLLTVSGTVPSTGTSPYSWTWMVSVNGATPVAATQCATDSGSGASAGATVTCTIPGGTLSAGTYAFALEVTDSASAAETAESLAAPTVTVAPALTAPSAPAVSATALDVDQPLTVTGSIPSTGTATYTWQWLVSVNGGSLALATQCATSGGTGASAGATETCVIVGSTLTVGSTYAFVLNVTDSASVPETQNSSPSATVSVASMLTAPTKPTVNRPALDTNQVLTVTGTLPSTGTSPYAWEWLVSVNGGAFGPTNQCAVNSGSGASPGATETCVIAGNSLAAGSHYNFKLQAADSATSAEMTNSTASRTVTVASALTAPGAPSVSATKLDVDQPLTVTGTVPSTGTSPYAWQWLVSVNSGAFVAASQCAVSSGSGALAGATETCSIGANTLTVGDHYAFKLKVGDSATTAESQTSVGSAKVIVKSALTAPGAPTVSTTTLVVTHTLTVTGRMPTTGWSTYSWQWMVSVNGGSPVPATQCAVASGSGAGANAKVTCTIAANALTIGDTYSFVLEVTDSATVGETQVSAPSQTVTVIV